MSKLLPCPLCNGTAEHSVWLTKCEDDSYLKYPVVVCKGCGLTLWGCEHEEYETIGKDEVKALAQLWNTRTPKERGVEIINRFEKALDRIKKNVTPQDDWSEEDFEHCKAVCDALEIASEVLKNEMHCIKEQIRSKKNQG